MVRIKYICWLALVLVLTAAGTAEAEERPTDPYTGEVITWDITGAGEEEMAGLPENQGREQDQPAAPWTLSAGGGRGGRKDPHL